MSWRKAQKEIGTRGNQDLMNQCDACSHFQYHPWGLLLLLDILTQETRQQTSIRLYWSCKAANGICWVASTSKPWINWQNLHWQQQLREPHETYQLHKDLILHVRHVYWCIVCSNNQDGNISITAAVLALRSASVASPCRRCACMLWKIGCFLWPSILWLARFV